MTAIQHLTAWLDNLADDWNTDHGSVSHDLRTWEATLVHAEPGRRYLRLATGGWSGNEALLADRRNDLFEWYSTWRLSATGGLHIFEYPFNRDLELRCPRCGWSFTVHNVPDGRSEPSYGPGVEWFCPHCGDGVSARPASAATTSVKVEPPSEVREGDEFYHVEAHPGPDRDEPRR